MKLASARISAFKRFTDLQIADIPESAKLVLLVGPNGVGKTSLFEAFNYWMIQVREQYHFDPLYHLKVGTQGIANWSEMLGRIAVRFHGVEGDPRENRASARRLFYFRSAYRNESDFTSNNLQQSDDVLIDSRRPQTLIAAETRVSDNYQRIVAGSIEALFDPNGRQRTAGEITDRLIGRVREAMTRVFPDLQLEGPGRPMQGGTFLFAKGISAGYHYKNLSAGEKAAFDLLLDFVVKSEAFNDTIFCIDEPELHMHSRLQARLLDELLRQLPENCQLWIATHSIGMTRRAMDLYREAPGEVVFLDFSERDFDAPVTMIPVRVDRRFWKRMFEVALDDLADLISPTNIVFCEGRNEGAAGRDPSFDAAVYRTIFGERHPDTEFVPLGGSADVDKDALLVGGVLARIFPTLRTWKLFDRDDRSPQEIAELRGAGTRVLNLRDLESYLWSDEVLLALVNAEGRPHEGPGIVSEKRRLLAALPAQGRPADDVKSIVGPLYNHCRQSLQLVGRGNNAVDFARITLAKLITPDTATYVELEADVFPELLPPVH